MNTRLILMGALAVLLSSCNSFNRTDSYVVHGDREKWAKEMMGPPPIKNPSAHGKVTQIESEEKDEKPEAKSPVRKPTPKPVRKAAVKTAPAEKPPTLCPMYSPPPEGKIPAIPFEELEAVKADPSKIDALERQHIIDLRAYISERRRVNEETQKKYLEDCQRILQRNAQ